MLSKRCQSVCYKDWWANPLFISPCNCHRYWNISFSMMHKPFKFCREENGSPHNHVKIVFLWSASSLIRRGRKLICTRFGLFYGWARHSQWNCSSSCIVSGHMGVNTVMEEHHFLYEQDRACTPYDFLQVLLAIPICIYSYHVVQELRKMPCAFQML
jgi:hypothetical protein